MAVPEFYKFFRPVLECLSDGSLQTLEEIRKAVIQRLSLTPQDLEERTAGGQTTRVYDRTQWATTYLRQAGLIESPQRATARITSLGTSYLQTAPKVIRPADLLQFPGYVDFQNRTRGTAKQGQAPPPTQAQIAASADAASPHEVIDSAHRSLNADLADQLLSHICNMPPAFFERLIVELMLRMGYGGLDENAGQTIGGSGDGGVDGVIRQDKLGLDKVYLQAKRYTEGKVGREKVQAFVGALSGQGATKGVFITTSSFTEEAQRYAATNQSFKLSLVEGQELARLMIEHDLGVSLVRRYDVKRIDSDFFQEL